VASIHFPSTPDSVDAWLENTLITGRSRSNDSGGPGLRGFCLILTWQALRSWLTNHSQRAINEGRTPAEGMGELCLAPRQLPTPCLSANLTLDRVRVSITQELLLRTRLEWGWMGTERAVWR